MSNVNFVKDLPFIPGYAAELPMIVKQSVTQKEASATVDVATFNIPKGHFEPGTAFRVTMFGTKSGTTTAIVFTFILNGTTVLTLTSGTTAAEWECKAVIASKAFAAQRVSGSIVVTAVDPVYDYAATTADMTNGGVMKIVATVASVDTGEVEYCLVEYLKGVD